MEKVRVRYVDILRSIAIMLMIFTHTARLFPQSMNQGPVKLFLLLEPITAALFLFLVGFSISLSYSSIPFEKVTDWKKKHYKKGLLLYGVSPALFFFEFGIQFPDLILSPNILSCIGISMLILTLVIHQKNFFILSLTSSILLLSVIFTYFHTTISGLTTGPGALIPLIAFALIGVLYERGREFGTYFKYLLVPALIVLLIPIDWVDYFTSIYHPDLSYFNHIGIYQKFWNHNLKGFILCLMSINIMLIIFRRFKFNNEVFKFLSNNSLFIYISHLIVLSIMFLAFEFSNNYLRHVEIINNVYFAYVVNILICIVLVKLKDKIYSWSSLRK